MGYPFETVFPDRIIGEQLAAQFGATAVTREVVALSEANCGCFVDESCHGSLGENHIKWNLCARTHEGKIVDANEHVGVLETSTYAHSERVEKQATSWEVLAQQFSHIIAEVDFFWNWEGSEKQEYVETVIYIL